MQDEVFGQFLDLIGLPEVTMRGGHLISERVSIKFVKNFKDWNLWNDGSAYSNTYDVTMMDEFEIQYCGVLKCFSALTL